MNTYAAELELALDLARVGGRAAMARFRRDPEARRKADGSWVTQGDWEAEAEIRAALGRVLPHHSVLGEEEGLTRAGGGEPLPDAPTWIVDPVDGTSNYVAGIPVWATLVGLAIDGHYVVGVAHAPALGETYEAARGLGARMNGDPIHVAKVASLEDATVVSPGYESFARHNADAFYRDLVTRAERSRGFGDFWGHMLVARGAAHVMIEPVLNTWDFAALVPIVEEAGGRISALDGTALADGSSGLTTNGTLHDAVVASYRATRRTD